MTIQNRLKEKSQQQPEQRKYYTISKGFHSIVKVVIWIVKLNRGKRLIRENYLKLKKEINELNGYYSNYSKGFIFKSEPSSDNLTIIDNVIEDLSIDQQETTPEKIEYRPISENTNSQYNFYRMFKSDLNNDYESHMKEWEQRFKNINLDITQLPALIKEAFTRFQNSLKEYYERKAKANMIYPNPYMTGRSNYKNIEGKKARAGRTEKIGIEKVEFAEKKLKSTLKNYSQSQEILNSLDINFTTENLNQEIAQIRKKFKPNLKSIRKAYGGARQGKKHVCYRFEYKEKIFDLELDEFGKYYLHPFNNYEKRDYQRFYSVREMINEFENFLKAQHLKNS